MVGLYTAKLRGVGTDETIIKAEPRGVQRWDVDLWHKGWRCRRQRLLPMVSDRCCQSSLEPPEQWLIELPVGTSTWLEIGQRCYESLSRASATFNYLLGPVFEGTLANNCKHRSLVIRAPGEKPAE